MHEKGDLTGKDNESFNPVEDGNDFMHDTPPFNQEEARKNAMYANEKLAQERMSRARDLERDHRFGIEYAKLSAEHNIPEQVNDMMLKYIDDEIKRAEAQGQSEIDLITRFEDGPMAAPDEFLFESSKLSGQILRCDGDPNHRYVANGTQGGPKSAIKNLLRLDSRKNIQYRIIEEANQQMAAIAERYSGDGRHIDFDKDNPTIISKIWWE